MGYVLLAVGLVLILEGLVYALAPSVLEELLEMMKQLPIQARRQIGLLCIVTGMILLWCAKALGVFSA